MQVKVMAREYDGPSTSVEVTAGKASSSCSLCHAGELYGPFTTRVSAFEALLGKSRDIPFSPLELAAEVRAEAACADDAEVDLSTWSFGGETPREAAARVVLRRLAVKWWAWYQEKSARSWLRTVPNDEWNVSGVEGCVRCIKACKYCKWVRGSRIHFWKIPVDRDHKGRLEEFRDGVKLWQLPGTTLPQGRRANVKTETWEQELLTRKKILRLWLCYYLELGVIKLVVPRFTVPKAGDDVKVVWDSKANGHNACIWAPSFLLGDSGDLEEMVVKWLSVPVDTYLKLGSPDEDYTQDAAIFFKSWQSDIDVGQQFNNFRANREDRPYLGVRMYRTQNDGSVEEEWFARYAVLHFGGRASPYVAGRMQRRILELCKGHPRDSLSRFGWDRVHLNLPTMRNWDPSLPRVLLLRADGEASQEVDYVDDNDIHPVTRGRDEVNAMLDAKQLRSRMNSLGNQADDKKFRRPLVSPNGIPKGDGNWKGFVSSVYNESPTSRGLFVQTME
jgi:hypothetical protein